jgi:hypothetical protein
VAATASLGGGAATGSAAAPPVLAVSVTGADTNPCTQVAPCASFNRAYRAAAPGQTVEVADGTYPDQVIGFDPSKTTTRDVTLRPAPGASVIVGTKPLTELHRTTVGLTVSGAKHLTIRDMTIRGDIEASDGAEDVTFQNLVSQNGVPGIYAPTRDITIRGGSFGNTLDYFAQVYPSANGTHNLNVLIDGVTLHDVRSEDLNAYHVACMLISDATGLIVRRIRTFNCDVFDLELGVFSDGVLRNALVENNFFGSEGPTVNASLALNTNTTSWNGLDVRNNSALAAMRHPDCTNGCANVRYSGNISPLPGFYPAACVPEVTYAHNVWTGGAKKCSRTDIAVANPGFVAPDASPPDLHLRPGSPAIGRGDPLNAPTIDIDGQKRPHPTQHAAVKPRPHVKKKRPKPQPRVDAGADQVVP